MAKRRSPAITCGFFLIQEGLRVDLRQRSPVDALRQAWQDGAAMNESEKQISFSRAALSTCGRAKSKFLSLQSRRLPVPRRWYTASALPGDGPQAFDKPRNGPSACPRRRAWASWRAKMSEEAFPSPHTPHPGPSTPALAESKFPISISYQLADGTSTTPRGAVPRSL